MSLYLMARWLHIAAGMVAFVTLWLPLVAKKGGPLHRRIGWVYVGAMAVSSATGLGISGWRFLQAPEENPYSLFLAYIGILAASSASLGVRVLRTKSRTGAHRHPFDLGLSALVLVLALVTGGWGLARGLPLLWGFSLVGVFSGATQLAYWLRAPRERMHWWFEHMGAMVASGIATLTAFLVVNARHLGVSGTQLALWLAPTVVGVVGLKLWERYYRQRFARGAKGNGATTAPAPAVRATP